MVRRFLPLNLLIQLNNWYTASLAVVLAHNQLIILMRGAKEPEKRVQHKLHITRHWRPSLIEAVIWFWCAEKCKLLFESGNFFDLTLNIIPRTVSYKGTLIFPIHMVPSQTGTNFIDLIALTWRSVNKSLFLQTKLTLFSNTYSVFQILHTEMRRFTHKKTECRKMDTFKPQQMET